MSSAATRREPRAARTRSGSNNTTTVLPASLPRTQAPSLAADPIEALAARSWARAELYAAGEIDWYEQSMNCRRPRSMA